MRCSRGGETPLKQSRPSSKERPGTTIEVSSDSDEDDDDDEKSLTSEQHRKNALDYAAEMNKRNAEAFKEMNRAKGDANDAYQAALRDEVEKEQRRKARIKLKKYYQRKKLEDEEKEKERLQTLCDEIFSLCGYGLLKELKLLKENSVGFDDALKHYTVQKDPKQLFFWLSVFWVNDGE